MTAPRSIWHHTHQRARRIVRWLWRVLVRVLVLLALIVVMGDGVIREASLRGRATALVRDDLFDYMSWEVDALWRKTRQELFGVQLYLDDEAGHTLVLDYLDTLAQVLALEAQIEQLYADPTIPDPAAAAADLRAQREALRDQLAADQPLAESIIEGQVSAVLAGEGFEVLGQVVPPVSMHFTEVPTLLIISPRDRIEFAVDISLGSLTVDERDALEAQIDAELDVSSLIVPLGGLSLYPSMIIETAAPAYAFEVTAHEWTHHYLMFFPLGWEYGLRPDTRIINETVATLVGREIALKVLARYYPEIAPPIYLSYNAPPAEALPPELAHDPDAPQPFDYGQMMHQTRVMVDLLLWKGWVDQAEAYMEAQHRLFVRHGYPIRKLNQAYFAFYGGYQGAPGAGGADPIGPAVQELRDVSPDLHAWLATMRDITTREQLLVTLDAARAAQ
ncbi:MAG: hypothetical protein JXJ20_12120 [Anaerolineae bacterium]|nr:hypothetical protein [Anaerolineae bacterium]